MNMNVYFLSRAFKGGARARGVPTARYVCFETLERRKLLAVPPSPTQVVLTTESSSSIDLSWQDNGNATNVIVERSSGGGNFAPIATLPGSATTYLDSTLAADTTYSYQVYASNASGQSPATTAVSDTTLPDFSQTSWVDPVNGSNSNSGTFSAPYQTVGYALSKVANAAGAGVVLRGGVYRESNLSLPGGSSAQPFTLMAEPTESPVISGFTLIPQSSWQLSQGNTYTTLVSELPLSLDVGDTAQTTGRQHRFDRRTVDHSHRRRHSNRQYHDDHRSGRSEQPHRHLRQ